MSFIIYDITFLVLFTLAVALFLYLRRHNLKREGLLYLYRTKLGLRIIEWTSKRFARLLRPLEYLVIASGYVLMLAMLYMLVRLSYYYLTSSAFVQQLRVPVLTPLLPYIDRLFAVDFLPPFYFTYWIIIIALIAIPHEFAHGIFARLHRIRIHSTGFGFLGPFLAAFVEQDEKDMNRAPKKAQLAVLAAGTFANILTMLLFALLLWLFIAATFTPAGVYFNTYAASELNVSDIVTVNALPLENATAFLTTTNETLVRISTRAGTNASVPPLHLRQSLLTASPKIFAYDDAPALKAHLEGAITSLDTIPIRSYTDLRTALALHAPYDNITITTKDDHKKEQQFNVTLAERDNKAFLGIGIAPLPSTGIRGFVYRIIATVKEPYVYYESRWGDFGIFIYDLLWWILVINLSVALVNMLPVGIFDGGRFFYLTVWGLTRSKKAGERAFKFSTAAILALVALLMLKWLFVVVF